MWYHVVVAGEFDDGGSRPRAINASGDVALQRENEDPRDAQGFVWSAGALTELVLPHGHVLMGVSGINASRVVVGDLEDVGTGTGDWRDVPVAWEDGQPTLLRTDAAASDINSSGALTGSFWSGNNARAFRWDDGIMTPLEPPTGMNVSEGLAINDAGQILALGLEPVLVAKQRVDIPSPRLHPSLRHRPVRSVGVPIYLRRRPGAGHVGIPSGITRYLLVCKKVTIGCGALWVTVDNPRTPPAARRANPLPTCSLRLRRPLRDMGSDTMSRVNKSYIFLLDSSPHAAL